MPYYLLWVGSPKKLPFEITHEIDSDYCVGLLELETPDEYARYAESVVAYETAAGVATAREVVFFGTRHPFDDATTLSADWLVGPLADGTASDPAVAAQLGFRQRKLVGATATRQALLQELEGAAQPTVRSLHGLARHGVAQWRSAPAGDARRAALPGFSRVRLRRCRHISSPAPMCPTLRASMGSSRSILPAMAAARRDHDLYAFDLGQDVPIIAPDPFVAALPRRLLAHPNGGALACIAHVERAWGSSITGVASSPQIRAFQRALATLLAGKPAGLAVQEFNDLSATLSEILARLLGEVARKHAVDDAELVSTWMARNDAGGFVLIGDPAVRLRVNDLL